MSKVKVAAFGISLDGFGAGPNQSLEAPLGVRGPELMSWFFPTKFFQQMHGDGGETGTTGIDNDFAIRSFDNVGAWILGRNMFGPIRGSWGDESWKGWWGDNPPYHMPVFVITHNARKPLEMAGGTTFYFETEGIEAALEKAKAAAKGKDVRIGGGVQTIRQYLQKGLIDEIHFAHSPVYLGQGENLLTGIDLPGLGFKIAEEKQGEGALHVILRKNSI
ncbi:dihydrofolate reductase [Leptospira gomenensis]|uniref:Dihydrofolate reductase n=1 Tax=Leptospira gomenensis TaxID=2484974 RepID=A0A5F1YZL4_9LEPT|nr:dihydrofolate reductase family protein [Leptospira gomenensis]TGK27555.1 dihydrofolate reductase [Leptospira gomenensis]TGK39880.1 dihydrofolate reductase [Leptospira gomenensis]TGK42636.1 dihydrofolate reductase [Leptospira gomenensis]TGK65799.1 dihydrofolate reductase [Leptospira gomenensis]